VNSQTSPSPYRQLLIEGRDALVDDAHRRKCSDDKSFQGCREPARGAVLGIRKGNTGSEIHGKKKEDAMGMTRYGGGETAYIAMCGEKGVTARNRQIVACWFIRARVARERHPRTVRRI
jgi:hypothetical protein